MSNKIKRLAIYNSVMIYRKFIDFLKICHILIIQRTIVLNTITIGFGVSLPMALKCGQLQGMTVLHQDTMHLHGQAKQVHLIRI